MRRTRQARTPLGPRPEDIRLYAHLVEYFDSYTERSRSGKGLHIWVGAEIGRGARKRGIEVYSQERFIICTGDVYVDSPIAKRQDHIDELTSRLRRDDGNVDDFASQRSRRHSPMLT